MKSNFSKWLAFAAAIIIFAGLSSCVKPRAGYTDFSNLQDFVIFQSGGLRTFAASNVNAGSADTVSKTAIITLASKNVSSTPLTVTVGVDDTKRTDYNTANGASYQAPTTAMYRIVNPTVTIPAGQNYATVTVEFYGKKMDPSVSYLLPLSIIDASGKNLSANENTIYYNVIGNPLAGKYNWTYKRWSGTADTTTANNGGGFTDQTVSISPITATSLLFPDSYTQTFISSNGGFVLSFKNTSGVLSNFTVALDAQTKADIPNGGFVLADGPKLVGFQIVGDQTTKFAGSTFRFYISYLNSSGAIRTLIDNFVKQ